MLSNMQTNETGSSAEAQEKLHNGGVETNSPPQRHTEFYTTTMVVLRIQKILYKVDIRLLKRFQVFRDMFDTASQHNADKREGLEDDDPIVLPGVTNFEFESLLRIFEPMHFWESAPTADLKQWSAVLHLCTMWYYDQLREHAIKEIEKLDPPPVDSILLARKCNVIKWLKPAYLRLCNRPEPITADEGSLLGIQLFADLCHLREKFRPVSSCNSSGSYVYCSSCGYDNNHSSCYNCGNTLSPNNTSSNNTNLDNAIDKLLENHDPQAAL
ncbi:hypothetical protein FRC03_005316 [Tulasnella sp. 419]|nr:hypothetical protein FRC03_005316 [Tulasnella sp. 419]